MLTHFIPAFETKWHSIILKEVYYKSIDDLKTAAEVFTTKSRHKYNPPPLSSTPLDKRFRDITN